MDMEYWDDPGGPEPSDYNDLILEDEECWDREWDDGGDDIFDVSDPYDIEYDVP